MENETLAKALTREWRKFLNGGNQRRLIQSFRNSGNDISDWYEKVVLTGAGTTLQQRLSQAADMASFIECNQHEPDYHELMTGANLLSCRNLLAENGWEFTLLEVMFMRNHYRPQNG